MNNIPKKLRADLAVDPSMRRCILDDEDCIGRVQFHHVWTYAGKQIQERFAIVPLCAMHHENEVHFRDQIRALSLARATEAELARYPKVDWFQLIERYLLQEV